MALLDVFQRHLTTSALKFAGGIELSSTPLSFWTIRHDQILPAFATKITKASLDAVRAFLDGLVHLTFPEWTVTTTKSAGPSQKPPLQLYDLNDVVSAIRLHESGQLMIEQDTRLLLMLSNFVYLLGTLTPNLVSQIDSTVSKVDDHNARARSPYR